MQPLVDWKVLSAKKDEQYRKLDSEYQDYIKDLRAQNETFRLQLAEAQSNLRYMEHLISKKEQECDELRQRVSKYTRGLGASFERAPNVKAFDNGCAGIQS